MHHIIKKFEPNYIWLVTLFIRYSQNNKTKNED